MMRGKGSYIVKIVLILVSMLVVGEVTGVAMDISVHDGEARQVILALAKEGHLDIVGTEQIQGTIDIDMKQVTAEEAISHIGQVKHFSVVSEHGRLVIVPNREKVSQHLYVFHPQYVSVANIKKALAPLLAKGNIQTIPGTNSVAVKGTLREIQDIKKLMKAVDCEPKQVQVDVVVLACNTEKLRESGVQWDWHLGHASGAEPGMDGDYSQIRIGHAEKEGAYGLLVKPTLHAKEQRGRGEVIAHPNMVAMNGEKATILIGDRIPVLVETEQANQTKTTISYEEAGIKLTYEPHITAKGLIDTTIQAEVSTPHLVPELKAYRITTRQASTHVTVKNGEALIIGGLMDAREDTTVEAIPLLSKLPIIGGLFRHKRQRHENTEVILVVRAHILSDLR